MLMSMHYNSIMHTSMSILVLNYKYTKITYIKTLGLFAFAQIKRDVLLFDNSWEHTLLHVKRVVILILIKLFVAVIFSYMKEIALVLFFAIIIFNHWGLDYYVEVSGIGKCFKIGELGNQSSTKGCDLWNLLWIDYCTCGNFQWLKYSESVFLVLFV